MSNFYRIYRLLGTSMPKRRAVLALVMGLTSTLVLCGCGRETAFDYHLETGLARLKGGEFEAAIVHLKKAAQRQPTSASAYCNLGIAYWKHGDLERAMEMLTMANDLDGSDSRPLELLAYVHMDAERFEDARLYLERANNGLPDQVRILTQLALLEYEVGNGAEAEAYLKRALQIDSNYGPALYNLGVYAMVDTKDEPAAQSYFARYVASNRNGSRVNDALKQLEQLRESRRPKLAPVPAPAEAQTPPVREAPAEASAPPPSQEPPQIVVAVPKAPAESASSTASAQDPDEAALTVRESSQPARTAKSAQAHWKMAMTAHTYKDWPAAVRHYESAMAMDPNLRRIAYNLGLAFKEMGKPEEARKALEAELKLDPGMVKAHYMLAVVLRDLKDIDGAMAAAGSTLKLDPHYGKAHFLLGLLSWEKGDFESSRQHFTRAVQDSPDAASRKRAEAWLKNLDQ